MWVSTTIVLFGAALNSEIERHTTAAPVAKTGG
jgi:hypothetical protein